MMADTEGELHEMAQALGLRREWYQGDHYDLTGARRRKAVAMGALETTSRELVKKFRR